MWMQNEKCTAFGEYSFSLSHLFDDKHAPGNNEAKL
jgi:hypothetical protein